MPSPWSFANVPIYDARAQPLLRVVAPDDAAEREAERVAESITSGGGPEPHVHEQLPGEIARAQCAECAAGEGSCAGCADEDEEEGPVFRSAEGAGGSTVPASARPAIERAVAGGGAPLRPELRDFYGRRMHTSFDHVRIHDGSEATRAARALSARAFTVGRDIVFGAGQFRPATRDGRRLIAHELVHTLQGGGGLIRRQEDQPRQPTRVPGPAPTPQPARPTPPRPPARPRATLADLPRLDVRPSRRGGPCACLVFIHNDERNARRTAELMWEQCSYNLAIITPDTGRREIRRFVNVGGRRPTNDPNELFPRRIAEECMNDPVGCQNFVTTTGATAAAGANPATVDEFITKRFFMAIHSCSNGFALPVVALHNNVVNDTADYLARLRGSRRRGDVVAELRRLGTDRRGLSPTGPVANRLRAAPFGRDTWAGVGGRPQSTNIFRWCTFPEIGRCHVGDPEHPDNVIWTTNPRDFEALRDANRNVVLQTAAASGGESDTDLSTLFLVVGDVIDQRVMDAIVRDLEVDVADLLRALAQLQGVHGDDARARAAAALVRLLRDALRWAVSAGVRKVRPTRPRFVNIETPWQDPAHKTEAQRADHRVESFRFIMAALRELERGRDQRLACCRPQEGGEAEIERQLRQPLPPVGR